MRKLIITSALVLAVVGSISAHAAMTNSTEVIHFSDRDYLPFCGLAQAHAGMLVPDRFVPLRILCS
jgi:hypothetical protein